MLCRCGVYWASRMLLAGSLPVALFAGSLPMSQGANGHYSGKQGHIIVVKVPTDDSAATVQGTFLGRFIRFSPKHDSTSRKDLSGCWG